MFLEPGRPRVNFSHPRPNYFIKKNKTTPRMQAEKHQTIGADSRLPGPDRLSPPRLIRHDLLAS